MRAQKYILKSENIGHLNQAIIVMRHFIELSQKLLPFLSEINQKEDPSPIEISDRKKIIDVFDSYEFNVQTSNHLIGSNVLSLLMDAFMKLKRNENAEKELQAFLDETSRLEEKWERIDSN